MSIKKYQVKGVELTQDELSLNDGKAGFKTAQRS